MPWARMAAVFQVDPELPEAVQLWGWTQGRVSRAEGAAGQGGEAQRAQILTGDKGHLETAC